MKHPCIEFITACNWCEIFGVFVQSLAEDFPEIEVRCDEAGVDMDYIPKYGVITSSVLIVNESIAISDLSKSIIRKTFKKLAKNGTIWFVIVN